MFEISFWQIRFYNSVLLWCPGSLLSSDFWSKFIVVPCLFSPAKQGEVKENEKERDVENLFSQKR